MDQGGRDPKCPSRHSPVAVPLTDHKNPPSTGRIVAIFAYEKGGPMFMVRAIFWTAAMAYTGFILTGQGLRTLNNLSITEAFLGALAGFFLAMMFTLRERRRQRPAFVGHSIARIFP